MTPVETLLRHLDRCPADFGARLVLADMLTDAGSPLADGMRYLAVTERVPLWDDRTADGRPVLPARFMWVADDNMHAWTGELVGHGRLTPHALPADLIKVTRSSERVVGTNTQFGWRDWLTIRAAYAAAAMGFYRLPADRRHDLLAPLYNPVVRPSTDCV